jgi:hypothetical protein
MTTWAKYENELTWLGELTSKEFKGPKKLFNGFHLVASGDIEIPQQQLRIRP